MTRSTTLFVALGLVLLGSTALATTKDSLQRRMEKLRTRYPNQVSIAYMNNRPAYFIKTDNMSTKQASTFRNALLYTLGTNTLRIWNTTDWLQVGTGKGSNKKLSSENRGKQFALYNHFRDMSWSLPEGQETSVLVKLKNTQLQNPRGKGFDQYINAIRNDFQGTLGETDYNGDYSGPPFVTGDPQSKHNCTSWMTNWLKREVGGGFRYGADPGSWCISTASNPTSAVRGLLVFNHPNTPQNGAQLQSSFPLHWGDVH